VSAATGDSYLIPYHASRKTRSLFACRVSRRDRRKEARRTFVAQPAPVTLRFIDSLPDAIVHRD
jgi:hypothetical protein